MADVPAAWVTSGAGSALTLAAAAVMAGDDDDRIQQLPDTTGMKNEFLIQRRQRYWYDRCLETSGAKLVEFGTDEGTTREDLENAIGPNTAAVHFYAVEQDPDHNVLPLEDCIEIGRANGIMVTSMRQARSIRWTTSASTCGWVLTSSASPPSTWAPPSRPA